MVALKATGSFTHGEAHFPVFNLTNGCDDGSVPTSQHRPVSPLSVAKMPMPLH
jgi:hypothetical protein